MSDLEFGVQKKEVDEESFDDNQSMMSRKRKTRKQSILLKQDDIIMEEEDGSVRNTTPGAAQVRRDLTSKKDHVESQDVRSMNSNIEDTMIDATKQQIELSQVAEEADSNREILDKTENVEEGEAYESKSDESEDTGKKIQVGESWYTEKEIQTMIDVSEKNCQFNTSEFVKLIFYHMIFFYGTFISGILCVLIFERGSFNFLYNINFVGCDKQFIGPAINSCLIGVSWYFVYMNYIENNANQPLDMAHFFLIIFSRILIVSFKNGLQSDFHNQLKREARLPSEINRNNQIINYLNNEKPDVQMQRIESVMIQLEIDPCEIEIFTNSIKTEQLSRLLNTKKLLEYDYKQVKYNPEEEEKFKGSGANQIALRIQDQLEQDKLRSGYGSQEISSILGMNKVLKIPVKNLIYEITMQNQCTVQDLEIPIIAVVIIVTAAYQGVMYLIEGVFFKSQDEMIIFFLILAPIAINYALNLRVFNAMYVILKQKKDENLMILQMIDPKSFLNNRQTLPQINMHSSTNLNALIKMLRLIKHLNHKQYIRSQYLVAFVIQLFSLLFILVSIELVAFKAKIASVGGYYFIFTTTLDFLIILANFTIIAIIGAEVNQFDSNLKLYMAQLNRQVYQASLLAKANQVHLDSNNNIQIMKHNSTQNKETSSNLLVKCTELKEQIDFVKEQIDDRIENGQVGLFKFNFDWAFIYEYSTVTLSVFVLMAQAIAIQNE